MKLLTNNGGKAPAWIVLVWPQDNTTQPIVQLGHYFQEDAERASKKAVSEGAARSVVANITDRFQLGRTVVRISDD